MSLAIERRRQPAWGFIIGSLLFALLLNVLPVAASWRNWWPDWLLLVAFYWALELPRNWGVYGSWFFGLAEDVVSYALLGYHGIGVALMAMVAGVANRRLRLFNVVEQLVIVFLLTVLVLVVRYWVDRLLGQAADWQSFGSALTTAFFSPPVSWCLMRFDPKLRRFNMQ